MVQALPPVVRKKLPHAASPLGVGELVTFKVGDLVALFGDLVGCMVGDLVGAKLAVGASGE